ncbi:MAG: CDP-alcohol phosphatidyltransferase family protein, partial [Deltaproteobacteria bacterium]|nr:CDP-alcohol phosphatidyltransferase family protein [Deltaproteobacteria bacterium]
MSSRPLISANAVTTARLLAMPFLAWVIYQGETGWWWALVVGTIIGCTDFVDGYLARKHGPTVLGGLLDPIADKVLIAAWYLPLSDVGVLPAWPVAFLLLRETLVTAMRSAFEQRDLRMKTTYLAKVKTWVQMQGLGVAVLMVLLRDSQHIMTWILGVGAVLPIVVMVPVYFIQKRIFWSALIMSALQGLVLGLYLTLELQAIVLVVLLFIVALTWISGANYFVVGYPKLRAAGDINSADLVRIIGAVAVPLAAVLCMTEASSVNIVAPLGVVVVELAVGGLDNLLSHHRKASGAASWAGRVLGSSALLALAALASMYGYQQWSLPLAFVGLTISIIGGASEFWRGRDYYLDAR